MNLRDRESAVTEPDAEHEAVLSYLNSSAWEERLAAARIKRQAIADRRAAEQSSREPKVPLSGPARVIAMVPPDVPEPDVATKREAPVAARRSMAGPLACLALVALLAVAAMAWRAFDGPVAGTSTGPETDVYSGDRIGDIADVRTTAMQATTAPGESPQATGIAAFAASLKEMSLTHDVTIVTSARQAEALSGLAIAQTAAPSVRVTPFEMSRSTVTFYHTADADAAQRLADSLGGETMDLTGMMSAPHTGTLEVYYAGS